MRRPKYISPSSLGLYYSRPEEFYTQRIADVPTPRQPQTEAMSVGSAFDAYVKNYIHEKLIGPTKGTEYALNTMVDEQVEEHNRAFARKAGAYCFQCYKTSGALATLCEELGSAVIGTIKMEKTVLKELELESGFSVPILGKPDLSFDISSRTFVLDWKVNGYCSARGVSPVRGYTCLRDGWVGAAHSRTHGQAHRDAVIKTVSGITVNVGMYLEEVSESWATQVVTYAWLLGASIGSEIYAGIDQLACAPLSGSPVPSIRISSYRMAISAEFQYKVAKKYVHLWKILSMDDSDLMKHFFKVDPFFSGTDSLNKCKMLNEMGGIYESEDPMDKALLALDTGAPFRRK